MSPVFVVGQSAHPLVTTAIHAGHDLRGEVLAEIALDDATRLREEDPFTDRLVVAGVPVIVSRSRFEVDLNRPRDSAVYTTPDTAWGLDVWRSPPPERLVERSLAEYDAFYGAMAQRLDGMTRQGPFLVLDLHSYNHRRRGAEAEPAPADENPEINVGTGSLDRDRFGPVAEQFIDSMSRQQVAGHVLDVRENVKFSGGQLSRWVNERYDGIGAALAVECRKDFMDEWTGIPDEAHLDELAQALRRAIAPTLDVLPGGVR
jgi:N-formylglutamate deformylase